MYQKSVGAVSLRLLLFALFTVLNAPAATLVWTNTSGGNWSSALNWNPHQTPSTGDTALITNNGTYTVTLDGDVTVSSLTVGGASGTQTLDDPSFTFAVSSAGAIKSNGAFNLGGILGGPGLLTVNGKFNWNGGMIGTNGVVTVATNGLVLASSGGQLEMSGILTNAGTLRLASGNLRCIAFSGYGGGIGLLVNSAGGLVDIQSDVSIEYFNDIGAAPQFINRGLARKSAGSGDSSINAPFYNSGTLQVQTGTVEISGGGSGNGVFQADAGATLAYPADYEMDGMITGAGTNLLRGGVFTFKGTITNGIMTWSGGLIATNSAGTVAMSGILDVVGGGDHEMTGILTNYGDIRLKGSLRLISFSTYGGGVGLLVSLGSAFTEFDGDGNLDYFSDTGTIPKFINRAHVINTINSGTNTIFAPFYNDSGTLDVAYPGRLLSIAGGGVGGTGLLIAEAGATLDFSGNFQVDRDLTGAGTVTFSAGNVMLNGSVLTSNAVLQGGAILGGTNGVIGDVFTWTSGGIGPYAKLTVATNAVLTVAGGGVMEMNGILTNAGTMRLVSGTLRCIAFSSYGGGVGLLVNSVGGLVDIQDDVTIDYFNDMAATTEIINKGTMRKSGGSGTTDILPPFFNPGTLDAETGIISLSRPYDLTGGTLNFGLTGLSNYGRINFPTAASLTGTLSATLNGGYVPIGGNSFDVMTYGSETGVFNNTNLPFADAWSVTYGGTVLTLNVLNARPSISSPTNQTVKELTTLTVTNTAADPDIPHQALSFSLASAPPGVTLTPLSTNGTVLTWTPQQTNSPSTNTIRVVVTDNGTPPLSATNSFTVIVQEVNVAPSLPTVSTRTVNASALLTVNNTATNFNIHSTNFGYGLVNPPSGATISSSGVITWTPARAQGPGTNTITTVVTNGNPYDVINPRLTSTNSFTVIVYAPTLAQPTNYTINVGQTVSFTATATDNDPSRILTFSIGSGPGSIGSGSGLFTWRAPAASGGTSNNIQLVVSDNSVPSVTDTKSFYVRVNPLSPSVTLKAISKTATNFQLQVTGPIGPDYILQASSNLKDTNSWTNRLTNTPVASPLILTDTNLAGFSNRVYRVQLSP